jgi:hypothetical protein
MSSGFLCVLFEKYFLVPYENFVYRMDPFRSAMTRLSQTNNLDRNHTSRMGMTLTQMMRESQSIDSGPTVMINSNGALKRSVSYLGRIKE